MNNLIGALLVLTGLIFSKSYGYKYFQEEIPNGDRIPHPCKPNYIWHGVGHKNSQGGGDRNQFGIDFDQNGKVRISTLCVW